MFYFSSIVHRIRVEGAVIKRVLRPRSYAKIIISTIQIISKLSAVLHIAYPPMFVSLFLRFTAAFSVNVRPGLCFKGGAEAGRDGKNWIVTGIPIVS